MNPVEYKSFTEQPLRVGGLIAYAVSSSHQAELRFAQIVELTVRVNAYSTRDGQPVDDGQPVIKVVAAWETGTTEDGEVTLVKDGQVITLENLDAMIPLEDYQVPRRYRVILQGAWEIAREAAVKREAKGSSPNKKPRRPKKPKAEVDNSFGTGICSQWGQHPHEAYGEHPADGGVGEMTLAPKIVTFEMCRRCANELYGTALGLKPDPRFRWIKEPRR